MPRLSAGILLYRRRGGAVEFFLVHMGGPFWAKRDVGAWSIPKGLAGDGETAEAAARREFAEETGFTADGNLRPLGEFRQPGGGKTVAAFLLEGDVDAERIESNTFELEWPPRSGRRQRFPEADRAGWFAPEVAVEKVTRGQRPVIAAACAALGIAPPSGGG